MTDQKTIPLVFPCENKVCTNKHDLIWTMLILWHYSFSWQVFKNEMTIDIVLLFLITYTVRVLIRTTKGMQVIARLELWYFVDFCARLQMGPKKRKKIINTPSNSPKTMNSLLVNSFRGTVLAIKWVRRHIPSCNCDILVIFVPGFEWDQKKWKILVH